MSPFEMLQALTKQQVQKVQVGQEEKMQLVHFQYLCYSGPDQATRERHAGQPGHIQELPNI